MMDNPLEQPAPDDPIERVHAYARDLAWGVAHGYWRSELYRVHPKDNPFSWIFTPSEDYKSIRRKYLDEKWGGYPPASDMMLSFGYVDANPANHPVPFSISQKSFNLLEAPASPPKIFISYRQNESSAFASLIEARLTLADPTIGIFIDKVLEGGEEWKRRIEQEVRRCDTFICVYGPDTPNSTMIPLEIAWAEESGSYIVPVLHHGFTRDCDGYPKQFKDLQDIAVEKESAEAYELAILKLLNTLGYPTLQSPRPQAPG